MSIVQPSSVLRRGPSMRWIVSCVFSVVFAGAVAAQGVTPSAIAGIATDSAGAPIEGARVLASHRPSGTTYAAITRADRLFTPPRMPLSGPYPVSVPQLGFRHSIQTGV